MTCPKCGWQTLTEQKFCRSCGANLQITTQPLADRNAAISEPPRTSISTRTSERAKTLVLWGFIVMFVHRRGGKEIDARRHRHCPRCFDVFSGNVSCRLSVPGIAPRKAGPQSAPTNGRPRCIPTTKKSAERTRDRLRPKHYRKDN